MILALLAFGIISRFVLLICANEGNDTILSNNVVDSSQLVMGNSSEFQNPEQLEESANLMFNEYWDCYLLNNPERATVLGHHQYDDRLDSYSQMSSDKEKVLLNEFLERANNMLPLAEHGSRTLRNLQLFISNLKNKLDSWDSGSHMFPVSKLSTPEKSLRYLLKYVKLNETKQYWNLLSRYRAMEKQIDEQIELMREGIRTQFTLSNYSLASGRRNYRNQSIEDSPFYKPFLNISSSVSPDEIAEIQKNASDVILNYLIPAFEKLDDFMEDEYLPKARPGVGVGSFPGGDEYYRQRLLYHLSDNNVTAEQIHALGLEEVSRISLEMEEVIHSLGLNFSRQEFNEYLRNEDSQHFNSEDEALQTYRNVLENVIMPKLLQMFKYIPGKKLVVEKMPKELANGPQAYYTIPSRDNSTPGTIFLDTSNLKSIAKYDVMTLSLHEGIPGHHFQLSYNMEQENLPEFIKHGMRSSAYIEGWALYAEYLGYEMGLYEDPYQRFGHLSYEMFRACRLVVDTGMHVLGWTRQQAIDYMMDHLAFALDAVVREVDRYITWPAQACSYKYGEIKIKQLRRKAEDALGDQFDIREFHDVFLRNQLPLAVVEKEIDLYISSSKNMIQS